tara:strand:+ start:1377 stop:1787 length:411 start_codon:yes stop_codon:yes gene_type:complete
VTHHENSKTIQRTKARTSGRQENDPRVEQRRTPQREGFTRSQQALQADEYQALELLTESQMKKMLHAEYIAATKKKSLEALFYIIKDCRNVMRHQPDNPNFGYYADEICYCRMELNRRGAENMKVSADGWSLTDEC